MDQGEELAGVGVALQLRGGGVGDLHQARRVPFEEGLCLRVVSSVFGKAACSGSHSGAARSARVGRRASRGTDRDNGGVRDDEKPARAAHVASGVDDEGFGGLRLRVTLWECLEDERI